MLHNLNGARLMSCRHRWDAVRRPEHLCFTYHRGATMNYANYKKARHTIDRMRGRAYSHVGSIKSRIISDTDTTETALNQNFRPENVLKRVLDLCIAISALVFLMPFMISAAIMVRLADRGPALFSQERIGRDGQTFQCYKFRSMITNSQEALDHLLATDPLAAAEWAADQKLRNDPRITKIGAFLRKTSLDELPQLINVIRGEMSIVGPRPIIQAEIPRYGSAFRDYVSVRPGLTGLWQVSGRNDTTYPERVAMDQNYARTNTVLGDIGIILRTVPAMLFSRGAF